jgi:tetratricopeptide (TPR) repeat protein
MIGVPSSDRPSPELRSARNDAQVMAEWVRRSFGEWLEAQCDGTPLLVVLEDLHWGDLASVKYLGEGLRALAKRPLMVLALARPEVHETFSNLWASAEKTEISLGRLAPRAAERLVRTALGDAVSASTVTRIVERADGNAFYLEELIRRVAENGSEELPETVLALVQSRLERLAPDARRILRAASIFGEVFWRGGVAVLLGESRDLDARLGELAASEIIAAERDTRYPGEQEFAFRHNLLREATYPMLTDVDRATGHRLAAEWLERVGEKNPLTMADHFEKGGRPERAVPWLALAAMTAFGDGENDAAITLGDRGIACGAQGTDRGMLRGAQMGAFMMSGRFPKSVDAGREAMDLADIGSTEWFGAAAGTFLSAAGVGDMGVMTPVLQAIMNVPVRPEPSGPYGSAVNCIVMGLAAMGQHDFARSLLERAEALGRETPDQDLVFELRLRASRGLLEMASGQLGVALVTLSEALNLGHRSGDAWGLATAGWYVVLALETTGHCERAERAYREFCEPRPGTIRDQGLLSLAYTMIHAGRPAEGMAALSTLLDGGNRFLAARARAGIALALLQSDDLVGASREATRVLEEAAMFPIATTLALGVLAQVDLRRGHLTEALALAERGLALPAGSTNNVSALLALVRAEALRSFEREREARDAIAKAADRILGMAAALDREPELRTSYLENVEVNVRTLKLASEWS